MGKSWLWLHEQNAEDSHQYVRLEGSHKPIALLDVYKPVLLGQMLDSLLTLSQPVLKSRFRELDIQEYQFEVLEDMLFHVFSDN